MARHDEKTSSGREKMLSGGDTGETSIRKVDRSPLASWSVACRPTFCISRMFMYKINCQVQKCWAFFFWGGTPRQGLCPWTPWGLCPQNLVIPLPISSGSITGEETCHLFIKEKLPRQIGPTDKKNQDFLSVVAVTASTSEDLPPPTH